MNDNSIPVIAVGRGNVGSALLRQLAKVLPQLSKRAAPLRIHGLLDERHRLFASEGLTPDTLRRLADGEETIAGLGEPRRQAGDESDLMRTLDDQALPKALVVDVTAAPLTAAHLHWLESGWGVVTANKKPLSDRQSAFDRLTERGKTYLHETTVGAGLPVVSALSDLLDSGDRVLEIRAAVSGTLGFICSACGQGKPFAEAVLEARQLGYTEPDPRDDLSGTDVARKALILARLMGHRAELEDLLAERLIPEALQDCRLDRFLERLPAESGEIDRRFAEAARNRLALRYILSVDQNGVSVGLAEEPEGSPFAALEGAENLFWIRTERYDLMPMAIKGPGAGAEVTAGGVLADILRAARRLRNK